ncbi:MAG: D-alanine--D-alanine ligase [Bacteroidota bacterium]|nr:D-alanine--D-alanine ligase [Bacteroidota bacterium]
MKPKIALVTGGLSGEAKISYQSALTFEAHVDRDKFELYRIDITAEGWLHMTPDGTRVSINKNDFSIPLADQPIRFDAILIGIHGTPGEDGKLQGYFDMLNLPYTSCDCATSAVTFNKRYTTAIAGASGIKVARSVLLHKGQPGPAESQIKDLNFPVFVKPNNGGSSIGMSKVKAASEELGIALDKAFKEDNQVLVEEFIEGREFTIGVFKSKGRVTALPITEIISRNEFFDYEAKYHGASTEVTPAEIDEAMADLIRTEAIKIYEVFNCNGVVRIDFIYHKREQRPYLLEINTIPGQSEASIIPQQVSKMGWTLREFYTALLEDCLRK